MKAVNYWDTLATPQHTSKGASRNRKRRVNYCSRKPEFNPVIVNISAPHGHFSRQSTWFSSFPAKPYLQLFLLYHSKHQLWPSPEKEFIALFVETPIKSPFSVKNEDKNKIKKSSNLPINGSQIFIGFRLEPCRILFLYSCRIIAVINFTVFLIKTFITIPANSRTCIMIVLSFKSIKQFVNLPKKKSNVTKIKRIAQF